MVKILTGVNDPIFSGRFGNDLGYNQFSGNQLWHWPYTDPVNYDFTKPDPNPPRPLLSEQPGLIDQYFSEVQGIDVVRIWLFEKLEGIRFDANRKIVGIDNDLRDNLLAILNSADAHGVKVYLCLFDAWVVKREPPSGLPPSRLPLYESWYQTTRNTMKDIVDNPLDFLNNVLRPLVDSIVGHPAVYAVDIMNEPEGMTQDTPVVSDSSMRSFISQCCNMLRPEIKASVGCMRSSTAKSYSDLPLDFCDFHSYGEVASLDSYRPSHYHSKPCIIGECGYTLYNTPVASRSANEVQTAKDYVNLALGKGYSGSLVWTKDFTSPANRAQIISWLKQFAGANNQVRPAQPMSFWEWLLSLFGL
jgi:hypothetical protein